MKKIIIGLTAIFMALALAIWYFGVFDKNPEGTIQRVYDETLLSDKISWQDKALNVTKAFVELNKATLAKSIINLTHPTATKAIMAEYQVYESEKNGIQVYMTIAFQGKLSEKNYIQKGKWSFTQRSNQAYEIIEDTAPFQGRQKSLERLKAWFLNEVFPSIKKTI